jgi:hypothetical protein
VKKRRNSASTTEANVEPAHVFFLCIASAPKNFPAAHSRSHNCAHAGPKQNQFGRKSIVKVLHHIRVRENFKKQCERNFRPRRIPAVTGNSLRTAEILNNSLSPPPLARPRIVDLTASRA